MSVNVPPISAAIRSFRVGQDGSTIITPLADPAACPRTIRRTSPNLPRDAVFVDRRPERQAALVHRADDGPIDLFPGHHRTMLKLGVDVGGTFTDLVVFD
ncbi:MAG TPA: hypothetical protein VHS58_21245, partial [Acetobacteraceae bacterium]|nr:hypothetical protein [Acetobacteraceae bacterium]